MSRFDQYNIDHTLRYFWPVLALILFLIMFIIGAINASHNPCRNKDCIIMDDYLSAM